MSKFLTHISTATLLSGAFLITSCSSGGGGGGGGITATVPANAITIDSTNAESTVQAAVSAADGLDSTISAIGVETASVMGLNAALEIIRPLIKNRNGNTDIDLASGASISETLNCSGGGTASISGNETDNGSTSSGSVVVKFNNCDELGIIIDGNVSASFFDNFSTGAYTFDLTGTFSVSVSGPDAITIEMTGIILSETGNDFDGTYTTTAYTYALNFISNGSGSGGFLVELLEPIVESNGDNCPESGHILITGANGSTAEGIFNGDSSSFTVKANGEIVNANAFCI
jgi:hypothetical protein